MTLFSTISDFGRSLSSTGTFSIRSNTSMPSMACPKMVYVPSKCGCVPYVMKNWLPADSTQVEQHAQRCSIDHVHSMTSPWLLKDVSYLRFWQRYFLAPYNLTHEARCTSSTTFSVSRRSQQASLKQHTSYRLCLDQSLPLIRLQFCHVLEMLLFHPQICRLVCQK